MTLYAAQVYVQDALDGLIAPGDFAPVQAWVLPPPVTYPAENPQVYVWGGSGDEQRATLPRELAQKRVAHTMALYVQWVCDTSQANAGAFPLLVDAIRATVRTIDLKVNVVDPVTGDVSQLSDIGERITWEYGTPVATESQRLLLFSCLIRLPFHEWFKG